jgi:hypothetical protein
LAEEKMFMQQSPSALALIFMIFYICEVRVCLKNAHRAENASFGTCAARLFQAIEHRYSQKKIRLPRAQKLHFHLRQHFSDTL